MKPPGADMPIAVTKRYGYANFNNKTELAVTAFGRSSVVDIGTKLNKRFVPDMGRFCVIMPMRVNGPSAPAIEPATAPASAEAA